MMGDHCGGFLTGDTSEGRITRETHLTLGTRSPTMSQPHVQQRPASMGAHRRNKHTHTQFSLGSVVRLGQSVPYYTCIPSV